MSSHHRNLLNAHLLDDPFFPFPPSSLSSFPFPSFPSSSCPFLTFPSDPTLFPPFSPLAPPPPPLALLDPSSSSLLLHALTDRVAALELALASARPQPTRRKCTYVTDSGDGGRVKWTAEERPRGGERALKWEAELKCPHDDGFDRKWKWEAKGKGGGAASAARKVKWGTEVKGKGSLQPWSHAYTWEEEFSDSDDDEQEEEEEEYYHHHHKAVDHGKVGKDKKKKKEDKVVKKEKKCPSVAVKIEEIPDENSAGSAAIRKAFAIGNGKGKRKELAPQDAALLIQLNYRAHLAHRSQVLRCLRDLAVAKAKLKEIRSMFHNISYRRRIAHDQEERQRFSEKIIVLLLTVDALEGPDYMVRTSKKCMLEELEGMLAIVDPQPPGKQMSLSRRKFDLPEGGAISDEKASGVNNAVKVIKERK